MRLIDADALKKNMEFTCMGIMAGTESYNATLKEIDNAPTIEPERKTGEWIYDAEAYPLGDPYGHYDCDQCGESVPHKTNFCPNCGADMREGDA